MAKQKILLKKIREGVSTTTRSCRQLPCCKIYNYICEWKKLVIQYMRYQKVAWYQNIALKVPETCNAYRSLSPGAFSQNLSASRGPHEGSTQR
ncbi:hypothetical protein Scep_007453 [Stephania cephalantha]|uniref:Uncharacterized protein n=1 Tax=Stephania cephalantha TaxID=152367 RepID=A0AAP0K9Z4_9MAGN